MAKRLEERLGNELSQKLQILLKRSSEKRMSGQISITSLIRRAVDAGAVNSPSALRTAIYTRQSLSSNQKIWIEDYLAIPEFQPDWTQLSVEELREALQWYDGSAFKDLVIRTEKHKNPINRILYAEISWGDYNSEAPIPIILQAEFAPHDLNNAEVGVTQGALTLSIIDSSAQANLRLGHPDPVLLKGSVYVQAKGGPKEPLWHIRSADSLLDETLITNYEPLCYLSDLSNGSRIEFQFETFEKFIKVNLDQKLPISELSIEKLRVIEAVVKRYSLREHIDEHGSFILFFQRLRVECSNSKTSP